MKPFGPLSREMFQALVDAPHGSAAATIKKYDPLYGTGKEGPPPAFKWRVRFSRRAREEGFAIIEAPTEAEAERKAAEMSENEIDWDAGRDSDWGFEVTNVELDDP